MTVAELIDYLRQFDPAAPVAMYDSDIAVLPNADEYVVLTDIPVEV